MVGSVADAAAVLEEVEEEAEEDSVDWEVDDDDDADRAGDEDDLCDKLAMVTATVWRLRSCSCVCCLPFSPLASTTLATFPITSLVLSGHRPACWGGGKTDSSAFSSLLIEAEKSCGYVDSQC